MSCIAGLFHRTGEPADLQCLERMLACMRARAPDGDQNVCDGRLGLGHALLRTGRSPAEDGHPIRADKDVWITADARIDGRVELIGLLREKGRRVVDSAAHAELIVHAYHAFGDDFLNHLIGDFAFALWDGRTGTLICARDHFGVRPLYYAQVGEMFAFASDVQALLAHPNVSRELDEASVQDFLLFGSVQDAQRTIYRAIRCLPPATAAVLSGTTTTQRSYWKLPRPVEIRFRHREDYGHRFRELFERAVADRLPSGPVALQLSGGMDSTAIAAVAASRSQVTGFAAMGYNISTRSIVPEDDELQYAQIAANHLGLPMHSLDLGTYGLFDRSNSTELRTSTPVVYPFLAAHHDTLSQMTKSGACVLLSGLGGDAVMAPSLTYYPTLMRRGRLLSFAREVIYHVRHTRSLRGMGLSAALGRARPPPEWAPRMPDWIDGASDPQGLLAVRWHGWWDLYLKASDARQQLSLPWASRQFEALELLNMPVVGRYPFFDLRLVNFLQALPNFILSGKTVFREAMRNDLPPAITTRPKTALRGDVIRAIVTNRKLGYAQAWRRLEFPQPILQERYEQALDRYQSGDGAESTWASSLILAPVALRDWLTKAS